MLTIPKDDFHAYLAYQEYRRIADSDLRSVFNRVVLRYWPSFDAKRLYSAAVQMAEVQADLDAGLL